LKNMEGTCYSIKRVECKPWRDIYEINTSHEIIRVDVIYNGAGFITKYELSKNDNRIKVFHHNVNMGVSSARNTGIENATGDYIMFLDADDIYAENSLPELLKNALLFDANIVLGGKDIITENGSTSHSECYLPYYTPFNKKQIKEFFLNYFFYYFSNNKDSLNKEARWNFASCLYKHSFIKKFHLFFSPHILYGEDAKFALDTLSRAEQIIAIPNVVQLYFYDSTQVSNKYALKIGTATIEVYKFRKKFIKQNKLDKECKKMAVGMCWVGLVNYVQALVNRNYEKKIIFKFLRNKEILHCLFNVLFASKKNLAFMQISKRQKLAALFFLIKSYKKALGYC